LRLQQNNQHPLKVEQASLLKTFLVDQSRGSGLEKSELLRRACWWLKRAFGGRAGYFYITKSGRKTLLLWLTPGEILGTAAILSRPSEYLMSAEAIK
jgi:hypothetical protein